MCDERRLEDSVETGKHRMMDDSVAHGRFVDLPLLGIEDSKSAVGAMPIRSRYKFAMEQENILFHAFLKFLHIRA